MLGTFSFEPYFKSYRWFIDWSLEFLEIVFGSFFFHLQLLPLLSCRRRCAAPPAVDGRPRPRSASCWLPRVALMLPTALLGLRWSLPASPRRPEPPRGRHLAATVEGPLQHPRASSLARTSTTSTPASYSSPPFAFSVLPHLRTPPPPRLNSDELTPAVDPPPQTRSTHANPTIRSASS